MKRTRRGRYWHMGIVFLIYSSFHAYSATIGGNGGEDLGDDAGDLATDLPPNVSPNPLLYSTTGTTDGSEEEDSSTPETATAKIHHGHPTWRPRRENCTPPAIEQFPRPLMGPYVRTHGGLVLHVLVAMFTFLGLAIVCDDYFVSSLDRICEGKDLN